MQRTIACPRVGYAAPVSVASLVRTQRSCDALLFGRLGRLGREGFGFGLAGPSASRPRRSLLATSVTATGQPDEPKAPGAEQPAGASASGRVDASASHPLPGDTALVTPPAAPGTPGERFDLLKLLRAFVASIREWWVVHVQRRSLHAAEQTYKDDPKNAAKFASYLEELLRLRDAKEVVRLVQSKEHPNSPAVAVHYMEALVMSGQLHRFVNPGAAAADLAPGETHRSLPQLLRELEGQVAGQPQDEAPGASARRPMHVFVQGGAAQPGSKPAGPPVRA